MDNAVWALKVSAALEQLRNSLTQVSVMLKDYQATVDFSNEGLSVSMMQQALKEARGNLGPANFQSDQDNAGATSK